MSSDVGPDDDHDNGGIEVGADPAGPRFVPAWAMRDRRSTHERITRPARASERARIPPPLIRSRLPSGRAAMEQPNVTHEGDARLTPLFALTLAVTAALTGLFGSALMALLYTVEHLAFGFDSGTFENGAEHASVLRRFTSLAIAGVIGGVGWYLLRRYIKGPSEIDEAVWDGRSSGQAHQAAPTR